MYGWFSKDRYSFSRESTELYDIDKKEWVVEWVKKMIDDLNKTNKDDDQ